MWWRWMRAVLGLGLVLGTVAVALFTPAGLARMFLEQNFQTVVPGVHRSAQPSREDLERWSDQYGIQSILNLRRTRDGVAWWEAERAFAQERGIRHQTVRLNADRLPPPEKLAALIKILDDAPRPLLVHCEGGIERSGLAGAVAVLLDGGSPALAREQFDRRRGFIEWAAFSDLPWVVDGYAGWLAEQGLEHHPDRFRRWAREIYVPYFYRAELALVEVAERRVTVRVTNRSPQVIALRGGAPPGVRLGAHWLPSAGAALELRGEAADADLAPGETMTLSLEGPMDPRAGLLVVDLVDEGVEWFADMGSPALEIELAPRVP